MKKTHLKCDVTESSTLNEIQDAKIFSPILHKTPGYKEFCEPETKHYEKINKSVFNTISFYLEDDNPTEGNISERTLTFTLQLVKI